jgi:hypothetical protein
LLRGASSDHAATRVRCAAGTLCEIGADRTGIRERRRRVTERHGRPTADNSMRVLRAVCNPGMREHPTLPAKPCAYVDFYGTRRRRFQARPERLRQWGRAVFTLNPSCGTCSSLCC